jgi:hypothetical protein
MFLNQHLFIIGVIAKTYSTTQHTCKINTIHACNNIKENKKIHLLARLLNTWIFGYEK